MHSYSSLTNDLETMGLQRSGTLLAHTSMKSIGQVDGGADTVLDVLMDFHRDSGLFAMPSLTWDLALQEEPVFDVLHEPTVVGLLPEMFRRREGTIRSWHPTHSMCAYGKDAKAFLANDRNTHTPCAKESAWHKLIEQNATILMIGCDLTSCTFLHGTEEWANVPNRLNSPVRFTIIPPDGKKYATDSRPHRGNPSEQYHRIESDLITGGALTFGKFGDAEVRILNAKKTWEVAHSVLKANPHLFDE
ncbi:MAG: AAC(3) family N-acetyltransferase [Christensenellales bacterium]|jgi:aminoglycoside 3-N-acetyltransferase